MGGGMAGFHHEAFLYRDADEFLAGTVPFLHEAIEAGEPALVAVGRARGKALKAELDGATQIHFADMEALGRNPARIIPFWQRFLEENGGPDRPIRGIGEPVWPGRTRVEIDECQRHESLLNFAFWDGPAWRLLCPYDSVGLADDVLEAAHRSHGSVSGSGASRTAAAGAALDPYAVEPFAGVLPPRPANAATIEFGRQQLAEARALVRTEAGRIGLSADRTFDLVTAVSEVAANSVSHGGGRGMLSVWAEEGAIFAEVEDAGRIEEPLTGRRRPAPSQSGGRGVWIANQLCDLVQIRSGEAGTAVRLRIESSGRA